MYCCYLCCRNQLKNGKTKNTANRLSSEEKETETLIYIIRCKSFADAPADGGREKETNAGRRLPVGK